MQNKKPLGPLIYEPCVVCGVSKWRTRGASGGEYVWVYRCYGTPAGSHIGALLQSTAAAEYLRKHGK